MAGKAVLGRAVLELSTDGTDLSKGLDDAQKKTTDWGDKIGGIAKAAILGVGAAAIGIAATSIKAAMDAQAISAQTTAVLESTRGISGMTQESVEALALSLSNVIPIEDDLIQETENMLLTFTNVGKDVFPLATETALNMAVAIGGSPVDAAVQLGKALNDPIKGISALSRVGVTFTEDQKKVIQSLQEGGDMAGAQAVILRELATEFGNSGRAAGQTMAGQLKIAQTALGNVQEEIGMALLPILAELLTQLTPLIRSFGEWLPGALASTRAWFKENESTIRTVSEVIGTLAGVILPALGAAFGVAMSVVGAIIGTFQTMINTIQMAISWVQRLGSAISNLPGVQGIMGAVGAIGGALRGYAEGGIVPGPLGAPQIAVVHGGETVIPAGGAEDRPIVIMLDGEVIARAVGNRQQQRSFLAGAAIG